MRISPRVLPLAIAAFALCLAPLVTSSFAQGGDAASDQTDLRNSMRQMQGSISALGAIFKAEEPEIYAALKPVRALQGAIVKAKLAQPPADLGDLEQSVETSLSQISIGLAKALAAAASLEVAILEDNTEGAREAFLAISAAQREGHNMVQFPLREMRAAKVLTGLDDLEITDAIVESLVGVYHIEAMGKNASLTRTTEGRLSIQIEGQPQLDLRLQENGDLRPTAAPQVLIRPVLDGGKASSIEIHQGERVVIAPRVEE